MALWKQAHDTMRLNNRVNASNEWKGLLNFTDTIKIQLEQGDIFIDNLTDKELEEKIETVLHGGSISSKPLSTPPLSTWCWLGRKKWWIVRIFYTAALIALEHLLRFGSPISDYDVVSNFELLFFALCYAVICLIVAVTLGENLSKGSVIFVSACGLCVPFFFYRVTHRDAVLPGVFLGLYLMFAVGSTKRSRVVLFGVPFFGNYCAVLIWFLCTY